MPSSDSFLQMWLTTADHTALLQRLPEEPCFSNFINGLSGLNVDDGQTFQTLEGFGFALTGGSALLISRLCGEARSALLGELFAPGETGIGVGFLRLSIGASDLSVRSFSYNDLPPGEEDFALARFDLEAGDREVIPLLREILGVNPAVKIIATAWSAPPWMKTNGGFIGGELRPECLGVYAAYLVKYLLAMRARGITVHAITPQNEPLNDKNEPSMVMAADQQAEFIKHHLGPALWAAGLEDVALLCWDHNCDRYDYPLAVFADPEARRYLAGSAWHLYGGDIAVLSDIQRAYPEMQLYFTEQWVGADGEFGGDLMWHGRNVLVGATRHWCRVVLEWNLASDPHCRPHTPGGEPRCVGALTIGEGGEVTRNVAYYIIAHAAKFVPPGSVRIHSDDWPELPNVAFRTPDGLIVLIALNDSPETRTCNIVYRGTSAAVRWPGRSMATLVWPGASLG